MVVGIFSPRKKISPKNGDPQTPLSMTSWEVNVHGSWITLHAHFDVKYWNDADWVSFDRGAILQIVPALLTEQKATCIYVGETGYDIDLHEKTQTNRVTGTIRPIMINNFVKQQTFRQEKSLEWGDITEESIPTEFCCPVSCCPMTQPVSAEDGHTYEYSYISTWLKKKSTSPITNEPMGHFLTHNRNLRSLMQKHIEELKSIARDDVCDVPKQYKCPRIR